MRIYLLPHQDDEFALLQWISDDLSAGEDFRLVFLTDGTFGGVDSERRNAESRYVLGKIGVQEEHMYFLGTRESVHDGSMHKELERIWQVLIAWIENEDINPTAVMMPAWEGGHQDHDSTHIIGMSLAARYSCERASSQVPYYHGYRMPWITFRVQAPLSVNGEAQLRQIPWRQRLMYLRLYFHYTSQWKTWMALFPFVAVNILVRGAEVTQAVHRERLREPPHEGSPLYEKRGFARQSDVMTYLGEFMGNLEDKD